ncbi:hypothetical protein B046DRAFT_06972 [Streptomyces sp. LamerLS-316]|uniref:hypothetical protein n=1 Tax=unclassified Streptomyces TaxID=2593676 RepID=UPI000823EDEA|nr:MULTISPECIES: hypothetical protein [unclassified Streptomyces]MYQ39626.1 hypothetical protein [Streptomyces sp. SID4921]SCK25695.1 hypothetical protein B046DRAFT_06972 [Streptomyces sp. LamerLS-316]
MLTLPELPEGYELLDLVEPAVVENEPDRHLQPLDEATVRLMRRETRIGLARGPVRQVESHVPGHVGHDISLICVIQTHPESFVRWSRLVIDLSATGGAVVADMSPSLVEGEHPVEIETTLGGGLTFQVAASAVGAELVPQMTRRRTLYCPRITSSGIGFTTAYWDFRASDQEFLHVNEELRLLVDAPAGVPVEAKVTMRVRVMPRGIARIVRLTGKLGTREKLCRLAGPGVLQDEAPGMSG